MTELHLPHLSEIACYDDITCSSKAIKRGMHCPLFGCVLLSRYVQDLSILIVGTDECGFYSRDIIKVVSPDPLSCPVYTYTIEERDVIYGCGDQILSSLREITRRDHPAAICVVSTCVPELIGEDLAGVVYEANDTLELPVLYCAAHNFGENSHVDGQSDLLACLSQLMEPCSPIPGRVNLLCGRDESEGQTELARWLADHHAEVGLQLPSRCSVEQIRRAASASLNIVTDPIGLKLAKKMQAQFSIPYVLFGKYADPERILRSYCHLETWLHLPHDTALDQKARSLSALWEQIGSLLQGKTYIYSNSPLILEDFMLMLGKYGAVPLACYIISKEDFERELFPELQDSGLNPLVTMLADFSISETLIRQQHPDFYLGRLSPSFVEETGICCLDFEDISGGQGFEALETVLTYLLTHLKEEL